MPQKILKAHQNTFCRQLTKIINLSGGVTKPKQKAELTHHCLEKIIIKIKIGKFNTSKCLVS